MTTISWRKCLRLGIDIHHKLNWNYSTEKKINGGWTTYYGIENNCKLVDFWLWDKKKRLLSLMLSYMDVKFGGAISLENLRER